MATKTHGKSMTQPERAFWRDVFIAIAAQCAGGRSNEKLVAKASDVADLAVAEYRQRITWRQS